MNTGTAKKYQELLQEFSKTPRADVNGFRKKTEEVLSEFFKLDEVYTIASRSATVEEVNENIAKPLCALNHTIKPMILIEICFCDSVADCVIYNSRFDDICCAIVRTLTGKSITLNKQSEIKKEKIKKEDNKSMYIFSQNWYLYKYPDVAKSNYKDDPYIHYIKYGKKEGRLPLPPIPNEYNEGDYLELNPDVATAVKKGVYASGLHHYMCYGFKENRKLCKEK